MCFGDRGGEDSRLAPQPLIAGPAQGGSHYFAPSSRGTGPGRIRGSQKTRGSRPATAGQGGSSSSAPSRGSRPPQRPQRTEKFMTQRILDEYLQALHHGFGALDYGVIGGAALAKYGNKRGTSDIDVIIPDYISEVAESQLLEKNVGIIRTDRGHLG